MYSCRVCKRTDLKKVDLRKDVAVYRGICKGCASKMESCNQLLKRVEKNPEKYMSCNDCDKIFVRFGSWNALNPRTNCPGCKSDKIERY